MLLIIIFIFLIGYLVYLFSTKKKKAFWEVLGAFALIIVIAIALLFNKKENLIWVNKPYDSKQSITLEIKHKKVLVTGTTYKFQVKKSIEELFSIVKNQYSNASLKDGQISIFKGNHYYKIKLLENKGKKNMYELYADYIVLRDSSLDKFYDIPFPSDVVDDMRIDKVQFSVDCDFNYLKDYYKEFTNVTIEDSKITIDDYKKLILNYNNGQVAVEIN